MIVQDIYIDDYDWLVVIFWFPRREYYDELIDELINADADNKIINKILKVISNINTGFTFTNYEQKVCVVGISKASSTGELLNTTTHESKHIQSAICSYYNIDEKGEQAAYLIGELAREICFVLCNIIRDN